MRPGPALLLPITALVAGWAAVPSQTADPAQAEATGIVLFVQQGSGAFSVDGFTLRTADGSLLTFTLGPLDIAGGSFDAPHLRVHQLTAQPVVVDYRREGQVLVAVRLRDAATSSAIVSKSP